MVRNEAVVECIGKKRTLLNISLNSIGRILKINYLLHDAVKGHDGNERSRKKKRTP